MRLIAATLFHSALIMISFTRSTSFLVKTQRLSRASSRYASSSLISIPECIKCQDGDAKFIDGTWFHKGDLNGRQLFEEGPRIANACYFDLTDIADTSTTNLFAMLPKSDLFSAYTKAHGISSTDQQIIIYGQHNAPFLPRVWFTFYNQGYHNTRIMDGQMQDFEKQGGKMETGQTHVLTAAELIEKHKADSITSNDNSNSNVIDLARMQQFVQDKNSIILDARGSSYAKGHIDGAIQVPYSSIETAGSRDEMKSIFANQGVDISDTSKPIVCSCGSGVSACTLVLALRECGRTDNVYMYDGSWQEWKTTV